MFEGICDALHREMDHLDEKLSGGAQLNGQDLEHIDKMAHALKSLKTYEAMIGNSEYGSYKRSRTAGRYVSRETRDDGYDRRY